MKIKPYFIFLIDLIILVIGLNFIGHYCLFLAKKIYPAISFLDKDNAYLTITIHHILQAVFGLILIGILGSIKKIKFTDFGFQVKEFKESLKPIFIFALVFTLIQAVGILMYVYLFNLPLYLNFKLSLFNFVGYFLFELLLSGTSEEILFRSFLLVFVNLTLINVIKNHKMIKIYSVIISSAAFMIGHIGIDFQTFKITYFNVIQQISCLILTIFYCWLFFKYKNIYSAMLTHNILNAIVTIITALVFITYPQST